jgi:hypothetical protein
MHNKKYENEPNQKYMNVFEIFQFLHTELKTKQHKVDLKL